MNVCLRELADAGRLVDGGGEFGEQFGGTDADGAGDVFGAQHGLLDAAGDGLRRAEQAAAAGDVQKSLIDRHDLDLVRVVLKERHQPVVDGGVGPEVWWQEDRLRAEPRRLPHRHGRAHPAGARLIGRRGDDAAAARLTADHHREAAKLWTLDLLDRREEGVHIYVEDGS